MPVVIPVSQGSSTVSPWLASAARTTGSTTDQLLVDRFSSIAILVDVTVVSGTSPTLNVYLQNLMPDGTTWSDIGSMNQITATGKYAMGQLPGGNSTFTVVTGSLAAGTQRTFPLGAKIRIQYVIGGTSPSFTFSIHAELIV